MKTAEIITAKVLELMEEHGTNWTKPWVGNGIARNALTDKHYRGGNALFLSMVGETPFWATYKQWRTLGAQVRKGEKGTGILVYKTGVKEDKKTGEQKGFRFFRTYSVFNASQVDGWEMPETREFSEEERLIEVDDFIDGTGANIEYVNRGGRAFCSPGKDRITMPALPDFIDTETSTAAEAFYSTALHELGHWTGHRHRLNRLKNAPFGTPEYAFEELVAELTAAILCVTLGISMDPRPDHAKYLNAWIAKLRTDEHAFQKAASQAQKAVDYLEGLQAMEEAA